MDQVVAAAFIDGSRSPVYSNHRILGVRLRKFCLWHRWLLNTIDSPFMRKGPVTMFDLRTAVGICRLSYQETYVRRPWLTPILIYAKALCASLWCRKPGPCPSDPEGKQNHLQRTLQKRADAFLKYTSDYLQDPEYAIIPPEHGPKYVPQTPRGRFDDCIEHIGELIAFGIPERCAWEMPIGRARVYRIIARRVAGNDVDVTTPEELAFRKTVPPQFRNKVEK